MRDEAMAEIRMIRALMQEARDVTAAWGPHFVWWGSLATVGLVVTWLRVAHGAAVPVRGVWLGILLVGWAGSWALMRRAGRRAGRRSSAGRVLGGIWVGTGATLTAITGSSLLAGSPADVTLPGLCCLVFGGGYWATSRLTGRRSMAIGAWGWWLVGTAMLVWPGLWTIAAMAGLILGLVVVPGAFPPRDATAVGGGASPADEVA